MCSPHTCITQKDGEELLEQDSYVQYSEQTLTPHFKRPHLQEVHFKNGLWVWEFILLEVVIEPTAWRAEVRYASSFSGREENGGGGERRDGDGSSSL